MGYITLTDQRPKTPMIIAKMQKKCLIKYNIPLMIKTKPVTN
jgi:hypothetical protein